MAARIRRTVTGWVRSEAASRVAGYIPGGRFACSDSIRFVTSGEA